MILLRRLATVLVITGVGVSLSACGSSTPSVVGSYKATLVSPVKDPHEITFPLSLDAGGHFVLSLDSAGHAIRGTWNEHDDVVTLKGADGPAHVVLSIRQSGSNLGSPSHTGLFEGLRLYALKGVPGISWYAVRT